MKSKKFQYNALHEHNDRYNKQGGHSYWKNLKIFEYTWKKIMVLKKIVVLDYSFEKMLFF